MHEIRILYNKRLICKLCVWLGVPSGVDQGSGLAGQQPMALHLIGPAPDCPSPNHGQGQSARGRAAGSWWAGHGPSTWPPPPWIRGGAGSPTTHSLFPQLALPQIGPPHPNRGGPARLHPCMNLCTGLLVKFITRLWYVYIVEYYTVITMNHPLWL